MLLELEKWNNKIIINKIKNIIFKKLKIKKRKKSDCMKKMFLTSSFGYVEKLFKNFLENDLGLENKLKGKTVALIPTAALVENIDIHIKIAMEIYESLGMSITLLELTEVSETKAKDLINDSNILHISGGNTFFLMQEIQKKNLSDFIVKKVENGLIYVGESAGSAIMSPDIEYVSECDDKAFAPELKNTKGLNLLPFYPVPHYQSEPYKESCDRLVQKYKDKLHLVPFNNIQAITVEDDDYNLVTLQKI